MSHPWLVTLIVLTLWLTIIVMPNVSTVYSGNDLFETALLLILLLGRTKVAYVTGLVGGFIFDLLSIYPFGVYIFAYTVPLFITYRLFKSRITIRSLLAFISLVVTGLLVIKSSLLIAVTVGARLIEQSLSIHPLEQWVRMVI